MAGAHTLLEADTLSEARKSFRWLVAELVVIVLGITIAYQVDLWREQRAERVEVRNGLETLLATMGEAARQDSLFAVGAMNRSAAASEFVHYLRDPERTADSTLAIFGRAIFRRSYSQSSLPWFRSLQSAGTLSLIDDYELRDDLLQFHNGHLEYVSDLVRELEDFEARLIDSSSPDIGPLPDRDAIEGEARVFTWGLQSSLESMPTDPRLPSAFGWVARRSQFVADRVLRGREDNLALQERLRMYLETL